MLIYGFSIPAIFDLMLIRVKMNQVFDLFIVSSILYLRILIFVLIIELDIIIFISCILIIINWTGKLILFSSLVVYRLRIIVHQIDKNVYEFYYYYYLDLIFYFMCSNYSMIRVQVFFNQVYSLFIYFYYLNLIIILF